MKISLTTRICMVIVFLALVAFWVLVGCGVYTNGFQSIKLQYITCDNQVMKSGNVVNLCDRSPVFALTGAGFKAVDWGEYKLSITANPKAEITYEADGKAYKAEDTDLTAGFGIEKQGNKFTISCGDYSLQNVLKSVIGDGVTITNIAENVAPYLMTVTDGNGKSFSYMLNYLRECKGITIEPDGIIVG
ncbi:MAG: hypothetical protein ACI4MN_04080 [Candidatus Coproplasma sp.]